ncbi:lipoyl(octanoyl) transferase LipB [Actinomadura livida]|uniref:Octanoyltransferase n=1 Tax=Actinomadura livida TaxID=79909 RepID=A0A7W7N038_9ACTN|nr:MULTISPECIES: lipoyl(octanoyl) transferase LipB [Actinomadura]MBB4776542.1 lipoyl(octanoyl) transferase [Actinomadura catellatispora]GGT93050.1 octanoyltransferase [Actinomadura livida]
MSDVDVRELVVVHAGFGTAAVPYTDGWELQKRTHALRVDDVIPDTVLLMEHEPVYTAGKRTGALDRPLGDPGAPVVDVDRGGKITWHGPGQLTGYPIVRLDDPKDVVGYVRLLERMMMDVCAEFGLETVTVEGHSGLWVPGAPNRKIGSIGIRVARGVAMHGFMLNCDNDLGWFDKIVPCGIRDVGSTSLSAELGRDVPVAEVVPMVERHLAAAFGAVAALHRTKAQLGA